MGFIRAKNKNKMSHLNWRETQCEINSSHPEMLECAVFYINLKSFCTRTIAHFTSKLPHIFIRTTTYLYQNYHIFSLELQHIFIRTTTKITSELPSNLHRNYHTICIRTTTQFTSEMPHILLYVSVSYIFISTTA